ncbi:MAG: CpsD/CapB family tyrosine-protein kinase [Ardenticatenales bacterium]|jgi:non-specific protein-tyrosine kinase|nr:CpsD/CapB family tyrosine-protein kinase [Ardenticatenales bacterium]
MTDLVTLADPESAAAEAFRALRTNLAFNRADRPLRSLLVTSPTAVEDGASVAANLAVATAHAGHRVVLVDGDLRRPAQHALFGLDNAVGLAQVLASESGEPLPLRPTDVPGLRVLTAGPPAAHPAALLDGPQTGALLARLGAEADIIILASPPVLAVSDAAVLAPLVDGVLLVLAAGRSRRDSTRAAREALDRVGANVLGVVLTEAGPSTADVRY